MTKIDPHRRGAAYARPDAIERKERNPYMRSRTC